MAKNKFRQTTKQVHENVHNGKFCLLGQTKQAKWVRSNWPQFGEVRPSSLQLRMLSAVLVYLGHRLELNNWPGTATANPAHGTHNTISNIYHIRADYHTTYGSCPSIHLVCL